MLLEINIENIFKEIQEYTNELYSSKLAWVGLGRENQFNMKYIYIFHIKTTFLTQPNPTHGHNGRSYIYIFHMKMNFSIQRNIGLN